MKAILLKLDDSVFKETEEMTARLQLARNRYINEAVSLYNRYHRRKQLKHQLTIESRQLGKVNLEILREFENLIDDPSAI